MLLIALLASAAISAQPIEFKKEARMCERQPEISWCQPGKVYPQRISGNEVQMLTREDQRVRQNFKPTDMGDTDDWKVYDPDKVMRDDCTGFAPTIVDAMVKDGWPPERIYRVITRTVEGDIHMVGMAVTSDGSRYIVGDSRAKGAYPASEMTHVVMFQSAVSEGRVWQRP